MDPRMLHDSIAQAYRRWRNGTGNTRPRSESELADAKTPESVLRQASDYFDQPIDDVRRVAVCR